MKFNEIFVLHISITKCNTNLYLYQFITYIIMSETVTVRIPKALKNDISKSDINLSEWVRESIAEKLIEFKRKKAVEHMDNVREKTKGMQINMAKAIIEWRRKH